MGFSTAIRQHLLAKYHGRCAYCGHEITQKAMQVDHIQPSYLGGSDKLPNLNPSCHACNNYKLTYSLEELRHHLSMQVRRARETSVNFRLAERYGLVKETGAVVVFYFERLQALRGEGQGS